MDIGNFFQRIITSCLLVGILVAFFGFLPAIVSSLFLCVVLCYVMMAEWPRFYDFFLAPIYPLLPFLYIIALNQSTRRAELFLLVVITAVHDSAAYLIGSWMGKHKILPQVSPGKSWEGAIGGTIASTGISYFILHNILFIEWLTKLSITQYILFAIAINFFGIIGDLFESWLKRRSNIKDSGNILPGHGGVLDRMDSLLGAIIPWVIISIYISPLI